MNNIKFAKIPLVKGNRMIRLGFGQHDFAWFIRLDLWYNGFRVSLQKEQPNEK